MSKKIATTSPGQGSQTVGMLAGLAAAHPLVRETFAEGSVALGIDLWSLSQEGPKEQLNETLSTQPALPVFDRFSLDTAMESINA